MVTTLSPHPAAKIPNILLSYLQQQPRAVRILDRSLRTVWDNCPSRSEEYCLFRDNDGTAVAIPQEGPDRQGWPVQRVFEQGDPAERFYWASNSSAPDGSCFRMRAWPLLSDRGGWNLVVEEIDRVSRRICFDERLKTLDHELADLIAQVAAILAGQDDTHLLRLRLANPNLQPCHELRQCARADCPAYGNTENLRCWQIDNTLCREGMETQNPLEKFICCDKCEVFALACPDPLTRVGENFNRLLSLLNLRHHEALEAQQHLQKADKMATMGEMVLGLAHEIKTPLSVIMGRLDCLALELDGLTAAEIGQDLIVMRQHAERMSRVLKEVLAMARPEAPRPRILDLGLCAREALAMTAHTLRDAGISAEAVLISDAPAIHADPVQVQQVLLNLILNARDAMPCGGRLVAETRMAEADKGMIELAMHDTGHGIPSEIREKVFSPFFTTKAERGGTGLGLAVCQRIMLNHGGRIRIDESPAGGTAVVLSFPVHKADKA